MIQTVRDWGLLETSDRKGVYTASTPRPQPSKELTVWLIRAVLLGGRRKLAPLDEILRSSALFPFELSITPQQLRQSGKVMMYRQGLDAELIGLMD